jgi:hypothetical protein
MLECNREKRKKREWSYMQQSSSNPPPQQYSHGMQYFIGIIIGVIPLALGLFSISGIIGSGSSLANYLFFAALLGYLAVFIAMIVCLCIPRVRFVGYGLLTLVLATPVVAFVACTVLIFRT